MKQSADLGTAPIHLGAAGQGAPTAAAGPFDRRVSKPGIPLTSVLGLADVKSLLSLATAGLTTFPPNGAWPFPRGNPLALWPVSFWVRVVKAKPEERTETPETGNRAFPLH